MAIYRLSVSIVSRASGGSALAAAAYRSASNLAELGAQAFDAVAAAAYRSGQNLTSEGQGAAYDYGRKSDVRHTEILLPTGAAPWLADRAALWNAVEASERRKDSQLAREILVTLPRELPEAARLELVRGFIHDQLISRGMVVDLAIHDGRARDGGRHPHAHLLLTMRHLDPTSRTGFGQKAVEWNRKELLQTWREAWAGHVNAALERGRISEAVDHRTLAAQRQEAVARGDWDKVAALDREPEPKLGRAAAALERNGQRTERGDLLREVHARNALRRDAYALVAELGDHAKAAFLQVRERTGDALAAFTQWSRERASQVLDASRDLLARLRDAIIPERSATETADAAEPTAPQPTLAAEDALDRLRRPLGPQLPDRTRPAAPVPEDSLSRLERGFQPAGHGQPTTPELPPRTKDALDRLKARLVAERQQERLQEPGSAPAGQDRVATPELPTRTRDAVDRLRARMAAERQQEKPGATSAGPSKDGTSELPARTQDALDRLRARMASQAEATPRPDPEREPPGRVRERVRDPGRGR
jgi:hypothetical protein